MKDKSTLRDLVWGGMIMLIVLLFIHRSSDEYKQSQDLKILKEQCELTLPRTEHCVIVAVPQSKD